MKTTLLTVILTLVTSTIALGSSEELEKDNKFTVFKEKLKACWTLKTWKNLKGGLDGKVLKFTQDEATKKWCGVLIENKYGDNALELNDKNKLKNTFLVIKMKTKDAGAYKVTLSALKQDNKFVNTHGYNLSKAIKKKDGETMTAEICLAEFKNIENLDAVRGVLFQSTKEIQPGLVLEIESIQFEHRK